MRTERPKTANAPRGPYLTASEAARDLGVSLPTLYAYVSRGLIRSEAGAAQRRARRYHAEDVASLQARKEARRDPGGAAQKTLAWGMPVLESAITLVADRRLYYRGRDAMQLALTRSLEDVAGLIWLDLPPEGVAPNLFAGPPQRQLDRLIEAAQIPGLRLNRYDESAAARGRRPGWGGLRPAARNGGQNGRVHPQAVGADRGEAL